MKYIFLLMILIIIAEAGFAQDIITKTNGVKVDCKITKEDSINYYIITAIKQKEINTLIPKSKVSAVTYGSTETHQLLGTDDNRIISKNNMYLSSKEITRILSSYPPALENYSRGQSTEILSYGFGFVGGYLIGYELGNQISTGQFSGSRFAIGSGLSVISLFMSVNAKKTKQRAIDMYNNKQKNEKEIGYEELPKLSISPNGLIVHF